MLEKLLLLFLSEAGGQLFPKKFLFIFELVSLIAVLPDQFFDPGETFIAHLGCRSVADAGARASGGQNLLFGFFGGGGGERNHLEILKKNL